MKPARFVIVVLLLASGCYQPRYDFDPHSQTIISCDGTPIYGVDISDDDNNVYAVSYNEKSGDTVRNSVTLLGPQQIGYRSNFPGMQPDRKYQITIGGGDATGSMVIETDSTGSIKKVDNRTPCK